MQKEQLLVRSNYSLLSSTISNKDIVEFSLKNKHTHSFFCEQKTIKGFLDFYFLAKSKKLIPICCLQFFWENSELLLIAKNKKGYENLVKISNQQEISQELLNEIIVIHLDGITIFEDHKDFYFANSDCQKSVYIRENKFLSNQDYELFCLITSIKNQTLLNDEISLNDHLKNDFLLQEDIEWNETWINNLKTIISLCQDYDLSIEKNNLSFDISESEIEKKKKILQITEKNLKIYSKKELIDLDKYSKRLNYEISIIEEKKYLDYFLIVHDFVNYCESKKHLIGIGRGSACGSLLSFLLRITKIDPIKHNLYFERFLNPKRIENPDIDIDIDSQKRKQLLQYLLEKYSEKHVFHMSSLQTFKFKNTLKDCAKSLEINEKHFLKNEKTIDEEELEDFLTKNKDKEIIRCINFVKKLNGFPKAITVHPAGIIISNVDLINNLPFFSIKDSRLKVCSYTFDTIQKLGFFKFDILSLNNLELISKIVNSLKEKLKDDFSIHDIDWDDKKVYQLLSQKMTCGIFQMEGIKMTDFLSEYKPENISDISQAISLVRPGSQKQMPLVLEIKNKRKKPLSLHPKINKYLSQTHGIIIYQEQVLEIVSEITGNTFADADLFRKAIAKKNKELLTDLKHEFFKLGEKNQYLNEDLKKIWDYIFEFSEFGFNKAHGIAYSHIAYQLGWLKANYTKDFYIWLFKVFGLEKKYLVEVYQVGFNISFPTIKHFYDEYTCIEKTIYMPFKKSLNLENNIWEKLINLKENLIQESLLKTIKYMLENSFTKEDILFLNKFNFFLPLFKDDENQLFIEQNIDLIHENLIFSNIEGLSNITTNSKNIEMDENTKNRFLNYEKEIFSVELLYEKIDKSDYEKHQAKNLIFLSKQTKSRENYLCIITKVRKTKTKKNTDMYWFEIESSNFIKLELPYFGDIPDISKIEKNKLFLLKIENFGGKKKIFSFLKIN